MNKSIFVFLVTFVLLDGCKTSIPREDVFVLDISQSIDVSAEQQMFVAVEDAAQQLHRGDTLTIIPITGNAEAELQGRTLRYSVPIAEDRQAYDADLRNLNAHIKGGLDRLQTDAVAHPSKHTDILGSIRVAMKEFSGKPSYKRLIVLSDFIQDDGQFNFRRDRRIANKSAAAALARTIVSQDGEHSNVKVVLGRMRSGEFSTLPLNRQYAINAFWETLFAPAKLCPDGFTAVRRSFQEW